MITALASVTHHPEPCDERQAAARLVHPARVGEQQLERVLEQQDGGQPHEHREQGQRQRSADNLV